MPTNKFHYIWMGRLPVGKYEDAFKAGPNALAQQLREYIHDAHREKTPGAPNPQDQEIIVWVPAAIIEEIRGAGLLDPEITLKPVEDLYTQAKCLTSEEKEDLRQCVDLLGEHNAYSAQKDLLSAVILEEYSGYYLDTTTAVDSVARLVEQQPSDVWFPRLTEASSEEGINYDGNQVIPPDVWALYNPRPSDGTFKAMTDSYIDRCKFFFPEKFDGKKFNLESVKIKEGDLKGEFKSGYTREESYGTGRELMSASEDRDTFIGQMVIMAFLDGLHATKGALTDAKMHTLSSMASEAPEGKMIKDFGIEKFHKGMWRSDVMAAIADEEVEARAEASPTSQTRASAAAEKMPTEPVVERVHSFPVRGSDFPNFKLRYQSLIGDALKSRIVDDFREKLSEISDKDTLDLYVEEFKGSEAYKVLSKGQDLTTKLLPIKTDSQKEVDRMIEEKEAQLRNPTSEA